MMSSTHSYPRRDTGNDWILARCMSHAYSLYYDHPLSLLNMASNQH